MEMFATPRQAQILDHLILGKSNKEIAAALGISPHTVNEHFKLLSRRFRPHGGVNRVELAVWWVCDDGMGRD